MRIKELLKQLSKLDPQLDVLCYCEDEEFQTSKHHFRLFEIQDVSIVEGERSRGEDHVPSLKIGRTPRSQKQVILEITADF